MPAAEVSERKQNHLPLSLTHHSLSLSLSILSFYLDGIMTLDGEVWSFYLTFEFKKFNLRDFDWCCSNPIKLTYRNEVFEKLKVL